MTGVLRILGLLGLGLLLTALFCLALFPYERLREPLANEIAARTGASVEIERVEGGLGWRGPELRAASVRLRWPDGAALALDEARVRPALALSWLRGDPALGVALDGPDGRLRGTLIAAETQRFDGRAEELDLSILPASAGVPLTGRANVDFALQASDGAARGTLELAARDGTLTLPDPPVAIPFQTLVAVLELDPAGGSRIEGLALDGPMLAIEGGGTLGPAPRPELAPLDLRFDVTVRDAGFRPILAGFGLRLDREGRARLRIQGTPARPRIR